MLVWRAVVIVVRIPMLAHVVLRRGVCFHTKAQRRKGSKVHINTEDAE
jgi:hypothetical protein